MTTSINSNVFAPASAYDMKGLHVIEFITNEQPYPAEKLMAKLQEFQSAFQEEIEEFSVGSSKLHSSPQLSVPFPEKDDEDIEVEALVKKNAMIKSAIEKIRKATEEQEKQLRDKEEELQELYETIAELEELDEELDEDTYQDQPQMFTKFRRARRLGCFFCHNDVTNPARSTTGRIYPGELHAFHQLKRLKQSTRC